MEVAELIPLLTVAAITVGITTAGISGLKYLSRKRNEALDSRISMCLVPVQKCCDETRLHFNDFKLAFSMASGFEDVKQYIRSIKNG